MDSNKVSPNEACNNGTNIANNNELRIVMVGRTGVGKSASGNTILGGECFESKCSPKSMTTDCSKGSSNVDGQQVAVIDTPGLFDTRFGEDKTIKDLSQCICYASPGPHIFLVVVPVGRFTEEEIKTVQMIQELFGEAADRYSMILFTRGDDLEDTIEDYVSESPELRVLVSRCNGQYHVFNNRLKDKKPQVTELLKKIRTIVDRNGGSHYTNEMFQEAERAIEEEKQRILQEKEEKICKEKEELERKIREKYEKEMQKIIEQIQAEREREREEEMRKFETQKKQLKEKQQREIQAEKSRQQSMYESEARETNIINNNELRIVMVGKTKNGKSASGNTILGRECFQSKCSPKSMTTDCSKGSSNVDGQQVAVIDTPGMFDTRFGEDKTIKDLSQCIRYSAPGPHIFLVVITVGRFTEEEIKTVQKIQEIFGEAADKYCMVLFTCGDDLEDTIEDYLSESPEVLDLVSRCNNQYHVFNNKMKDKKPQVTELLEKIRTIVDRNGGSHYTNEMFQEAERKIEEEKQRILKEKGEEIRKEKEELERKIRKDYEEEIKKMKEQFQVEIAREKKKREEALETLKEEQERKIQAAISRLQSKYESEAREKAEQIDNWHHLAETGIIVDRNGGSHYTNEMIEEGQTKIEKKKQRILKEKEELERKIKENNKEEVQKMNEKTQAKREKKEEQESKGTKRKHLEIQKKQLEEKQEREIQAEKSQMQSMYESEAREKAQQSNNFYNLAKVGEHFVQFVKNLSKK